jgi:uncharacterized protein (TIGR03435 family)
MIRCAAPTILLLMPFFAAGQSATSSPEFEAASVKPLPPGTPYGGMRGGPGSSSPGQIHYEATTLRAVVARAYGVQRFQIVGPKWLDDERFDIIAKIPANTTMPNFQLMLQKLLADRFHLELHKENRPLSVYEMTVAKSGLKMRPVPLPATPPPSSGDRPPGPLAGLQGFSTGEKVGLQGRAASMRQILIWLSDETRREIVDKTGLTEAYDFDLSWTPPESVALHDPSVADALDSAIEKQLGLKVRARKVPVDMLVIDRLERKPLEN